MVISWLWPDESGSVRLELTTKFGGEIRDNSEVRDGVEVKLDSVGILKPHHHRDKVEGIEREIFDEPGMGLDRDASTGLAARVDRLGHGAEQIRIGHGSLPPLSSSGRCQ